MSLEDEIVAWAASRPTWQQQALYQLATGSSEPLAATIASDLAAGKAPPGRALSVPDLPGATSSGSSVRFRSASPVAHVNALLDGQCLTFAPTGMTVVYGDNGSGKSGYARLLKQVVHARVREEVLTDVFEDRTVDSPSALIGYDVDDELHEDMWPERENPILRQVGFYDEPCGDAYITHETAVTYRPSTLVLFDRLIDLCDAVRADLDSRLVENARAKVPLPAVPDGTAIATFLSGLSGTTTAAQVEAACAIPDDVEAQIAALANEEGRLRATDPSRERKRLTELASKARLVHDHLTTLRTVLSASADEALVAAQETAVQHRAAASLASSASFEGEPLDAVGSEAWRAMWEAARRYAESEAYPDREFPETDRGDRCVLCQQELSADAGDRLRRFQSFMSDDTERQAADSQAVLEDLAQQVSQVEIEPRDVAVALATIEGADAELAQGCRDALAIYSSRQEALVRRSNGEEPRVPAPPDAPLAELESMETEATASAGTIDGSGLQATTSSLAAQRAELEGRRTAHAARDNIVKEVARLAERASIERARRQTDTTGVTRKSTELSRDHVTAVILDQFTRESHDLKLRRVTLDHPGGKKGQLMQKPALLAAKQSAQIDAVLSEGEQTALGLAGFLTEAFFDDSKSAIVLDDPVTSLDHLRREHVAARLCAFARDRQVIVFTHDITFVGDLRKAADEADVTFTPRAIERHGDGSIGVCREQHPWKAKDAKERLAQLEVDLQRIKKECPGWDAAAYEREVAEWAGNLSETWERIVHLEVVYQVVDRGTSEVRPKMFRLLARITADDDREFQASYGRCSKWLRRHDKSPDVNYVPPDVAELEAELQLVRAWHDRVRKYVN